MEGCFNGLFGAGGVDHQGNVVLEGFMDLPVVHTHADDGLHLLPDQVADQGIVIPLVHAAEYEDGRLVHAFQGIPGAVDVGGLGIVDEFHSSHGEDIFHAVFEGLEALDGFPDLLLTDPHGGGCDTCCHCVVL